MIEQFGGEDTGKHFIMINNIDYNESPGNVAGAAPGENAQQLMDRYMGHMIPSDALARLTPCDDGAGCLPQHGCDWCRRCRRVGYGWFSALPESTISLRLSRIRCLAGNTFQSSGTRENYRLPRRARLQPGRSKTLLGLLLLAFAALSDLIRLSRKQ